MLHKLALSIAICTMTLGFGAKKASGQGLREAKQLIVGSWKTDFQGYILYWTVKADQTYTYKVTLAGAQTLADVKGTYQLAETKGRGAFATGNSSTMGSTGIVMRLNPGTPGQLGQADRRKLLTEHFIADVPMNIKLRFDGLGLGMGIGVWPEDDDDGIPRYYK
jgi:hypothetical protein